jgi:hypothetical protein
MVGCSKLRKAECEALQKDCIWITSKGCRKKPIQEAIKPEVEPVKKKSPKTEPVKKKSPDAGPSKPVIPPETKERVDTFIQQMYVMYKAGIKLLEEKPHAKKWEFNILDSVRQYTPGFHSDRQNQSSLRENLNNLKTVLKLSFLHLGM